MLWEFPVYINSNFVLRLIPFLRQILSTINLIWLRVSLTPSTTVLFSRFRLRITLDRHGDCWMTLISRSYMPKPIGVTNICSVTVNSYQYTTLRAKVETTRGNDTKDQSSKIMKWTEWNKESHSSPTLLAHVWWYFCALVVPLVDCQSMLMNIIWICESR